MEIRRMHPEEAAIISQIYAKSWKYAYKGIVPQSYLDELKEDRWAPVLANSPYKSLVLLEDNKYIGTSAYAKSRDMVMDDWGEIISIYLLPEYFGKGYGKELINAAVKELIKDGYKRMYLWVLYENARARKFYECNNFKCTDDIVNIKIGGKDLKEIRYVYYAK